MKKLLGLLGMIMCLAGRAEAGMDTDYKGADAGFLVSSIGFTQPGLTWYVMRYRAVPPEPGSGNEALISISSKSLFEGRDYKNATVQGRVLIHRLKPGTYEFFSGYVSDSPSWEAAEPFSYLFTIKPGETTYAGSFIGSPTLSAHKSIWGGDIVNGGTMRVANEQERDFAVARKQNPNLPPIATTMVPDISSPLIFQKVMPVVIFVTP